MMRTCETMQLKFDQRIPYYGTDGVEGFDNYLFWIRFINAIEIESSMMKGYIKNELDGPIPNTQSLKNNL